mmetsp:Transcript_22889/g.68705  ORF Transcript_22889/g.68705 Transcript_22889/m.68705 type:complete len:384 (+) Transcript_22889:1076-2227(+)
MGRLARFASPPRESSSRSVATRRAEMPSVALATTAAKRGCRGMSAMALPNSVSAEPSTAPRARNASRPRRSRSSGGASTKGRASISWTDWQPQAASSSTTCVQSAERSAGAAKASKALYSASEKMRMHRPGAVRPARPARWSAEARLMARVVRRRRPVSSSMVATRARPESTTAVTPANVSEASAIGLATMTRRPWRAPWTTASCSSAGMAPYSVWTSMSVFSRRAAETRRISRAPGRNTSTSPASGASLSARSVASTTASSSAFRRLSSAASRGAPRFGYAISTGYARPEALTMVEPAATEPSPRSVADMTTSRSSGRKTACASRQSASATSESTPRSWNSSKITTLACSRLGSSRHMPKSTPSVTTSTRVRAERFASPRIA